MCLGRIEAAERIIGRGDDGGGDVTVTFRDNGLLFAVVPTPSTNAFFLLTLDTGVLIQLTATLAN